MPRGIQYKNTEIFERFRAKVALSMAFSLNTNKNFDVLSKIVFERSGVLLSKSTLRRVFQYDSCNKPTKFTLDIICKSIGFEDWKEFIEKEKYQSQFDLDQLISIFRLQGIHDHEQTKLIISKCSEYPYIFNLLDTIVQIAITNRDIKFLRELFDLPGVFDKKRDPLTIYYFIHNLVISLNQAELMPELVSYYGANSIAQEYMVEWYVDEDNLNGYYYELLQIYNKHKTTPEAQLFFHCLIYQYAIENNLPTQQWVDLISEFNETGSIHSIPRARRIGILLLEAREKSWLIEDILNNTQEFFQMLIEDNKIIAALYIVRMLFIKQCNELIVEVLKFTPDINGIEKNIWDRMNINQLKIYKAYALLTEDKKEEAIRKLREFDPVFVNVFIHNHIMNDFQVISDLIKDA